MKFVSVIKGILILITAGFASFTTTDTEIQNYIKTALINGCKPVIDICESKCGSIDLSKQVPLGCLPSEILRVDFKRATNNYIDLAKSLNVKNATINDLPIKIREKLEQTGTVLQSLKQDLK